MLPHGRPRRLAVLALAACAAGGAARAPKPAAPALQTDVPWLEPLPATPGESALAEALAAGAETPERLLQAARKEPGSVAAGLARLAAGWWLVENGRAAEALAPLLDPEIARTALVDYAAFTLGRAHEALGDFTAAAGAYRRAAEASAGGSLRCPALARAAEAHASAARFAEAAAVYEDALRDCPRALARSLLRLGELRERQGDRRAAAVAYDQLEREHPASPSALGARARGRELASLLGALTPAERAARAARRALALFDARELAEAEKALRAALALAPKGEGADLLRTRYGRTLLLRKHTRAGLTALALVPPNSPHAAEAEYHAARAEKRAEQRLAALERVATRHRDSPWAEEALLALAAHYQKDARDAEALPYYRRLVQEHPDGRYTDRSAWRVGWGDFRAGRYDDAARLFEWAARARAETGFTAGYLYWAGRAHQQLGRLPRARALYAEAVQRFKHAYHGQRAHEALLRLGAPDEAPATLLAARPTAADEIAEPHLTRLRQLLLAGRVDEALDELRALPAAPAALATIARLESRRGRLRPAISSMKRAFPGHAGSAGDLLPADVWRVLYPLEHRAQLEASAAAAELDPALVAALVCQESTFDAGAVSAAGARGLMQIMPATGRVLLRASGRRYRRSALHDAEVSLTLGTTYLRQMLDRFGGRAELALAAYNAGPHRVAAWTAGRGDVGVEEFVESIPFTETRTYVMTILAAREHYRRLYGLAPRPAAPAPRREALARP